MGQVVIGIGCACMGCVGGWLRDRVCCAVPRGKAGKGEETKLNSGHVTYSSPALPRDEQKEGEKRIF